MSRRTDKLTKHQRALFTVMMRALYRDLEACGLSGRDLARARIQTVLRNDERCLEDILVRLGEHRRAHLN